MPFAFNHSSGFNLAIVGGGAAGLATAIFAAEVTQSLSPKPRVVILDGAKSLGAKILVAGGGRCNVTHHQVRRQDYNGSQSVIRNVLAGFDEQATVRWFASLGVELKQEPTGKLFPVADSARVVLNALLRRCEQLGVEIRTNARVTAVAPRASDAEASPQDATGFALETTAGTVHAARVVLSTGGKSLPRSGSDGFGWEIATTLGHTVTPTYAALAPLVLAPHMFHTELAGITHDVELSVFVHQKRIDRRAGSLLWTHFGISGPVVMDASRHWIVARAQGLSPRMSCNVFPGETPEAVEQWLLKTTAARPKASMLTLLTTRLPERLAVALLHGVAVDPVRAARTSEAESTRPRGAGSGIAIDPALPAGQLSKVARRSLVTTLTDLTLPVTEHRGWNYAEVTAGGIPLAEVDYRTMQSRVQPGLFLAGEILDVDGRIGGFNFQWAWATGHAAGTALGRILSTRS